MKAKGWQTDANTIAAVCAAFSAFMSLMVSIGVAVSNRTDVEHAQRMATYTLTSSVLFSERSDLSLDTQIAQLDARIKLVRELGAQVTNSDSGADTPVGNSDGSDGNTAQMLADVSASEAGSVVEELREHPLTNIYNNIELVHSLERAELLNRRSAQLVTLNEMEEELGRVRRRRSHFEGCSEGTCPESPGTIRHNLARATREERALEVRIGQLRRDVSGEPVEIARTTPTTLEQVESSGLPQRTTQVVSLASVRYNILELARQAPQRDVATIVDALGMRAISIDEATSATRARELKRQGLLGEARAHFAHACRAGDHSACAELGTMLYRGDGGPRDRHSAADLWETACYSPEPVAFACFNLGGAYSDGRGRPRDVSRAELHFLLACRHGYRDACV